MGAFVCVMVVSLLMVWWNDAQPIALAQQPEPPL
jgi:hypothetical protein